MNGLKHDYDIGCIIEEYSDMIYRTACAYLGSESEAEDMVSEVLMKLLSRLNEGAFKDRQHMKAWVLRVTVNGCKDVLKSFRVKNTLPLDMSGEEISVGDFLEETDTKLDIGAALDSLTSEYRIVLYLYYYQEYSTKEISKLLNIPKNTVVSQLSRARKALRQRLRGYDTVNKGVTETHA